MSENTKNTLTASNRTGLPVMLPASLFLGCAPRSPPHRCCFWARRHRLHTTLPAKCKTLRKIQRGHLYHNARIAFYRTAGVPTCRRFGRSAILSQPVSVNDTSVTKVIGNDNSNGPCSLSPACSPLADCVCWLVHYAVLHDPTSERIVAIGR